jgi:hypothetical protein
MRFMRLGAPGAEIPAVSDGSTTWDLRPLTADIDGAFLSWRARRICASARRSPVPAR